MVRGRNGHRCRTRSEAAAGLVTGAAAWRTFAVVHGPVACGQHRHEFGLRRLRVNRVNMTGMRKGRRASAKEDQQDEKRLEPTEQLPAHENANKKSEAAWKGAEMSFGCVPRHDPRRAE